LLDCRQCNVANALFLATDRSALFNKKSNRGTMGNRVQSLQKFVESSKSKPPSTARICDDPLFGPDGAGAAASVLRQHSSNLMSIHFSNNAFGDKGMQTLASAFPSCRQLNSIEIGDNKLSIEGIRALAQVLPKCAALRHISVTDNNLVQVMCESLLLCSEIQRLKLARCNVGSACALYLASVLHRFDKMASLDLSGNPAIGVEGYSALLFPDALTSCNCCWPATRWEWRSQKCWLRR
jgi:Leucine Rich repeat